MDSIQYCNLSSSMQTSHKVSHIQCCNRLILCSCCYVNKVCSHYLELFEVLGYSTASTYHNDTFKQYWYTPELPQVRHLSCNLSDHPGKSCQDRESVQLWFSVLQVVGNFKCINAQDIQFLLYMSRTPMSIASKRRLERLRTWKSLLYAQVLCPGNIYQPTGYSHTAKGGPKANLVVLELKSYIIR